MSDEKQKAYEEWWSDPASPPSPRAGFYAGREAALANRPRVVETIRLIAQQQQREEIRVLMIARAVEAFKIGLYDRAKYYRELSEEIFGKV